jgi:hypothetical protein
MFPPIDTWTHSQAIGFSILFGVVGAAGVVGILYGLSCWAGRKPKGGATEPSWMGKGRPSTLDATPAPIVESAEPQGRVLVTDVVGCARCGGDHPRRLLLKFTRPPKDATHYTVCPITEEPLLVEVRNVDDPKPVRPTAPPNRLVREGEQPPARP